MSSFIRKACKTLGSAAIFASSLALAAGNIDINSATADELTLLNGVGPVLAAAIIEHRDLHGPFESVDDLARVSGIGPATISRNKTVITLGIE